MEEIAMRPTRFGFGKGVADTAAYDDRIIGLGADITSSVGMNFFKDKFPDRFFSFGIAEQNIAAVAAGLGLSGLIPVISTYATFLSTRALDQIRVSICYNNIHAIVGGAHAGISVGPDGATHQALEDIAIMRVLPNMTVISPCDATQAELAVNKAITTINGPVYIRFGRESVPDFTSPEQEFEIGKGQLLREGSNVSIIATGHMVFECLEAAKMLENENISAQVINIHTIKPIDKELIVWAAKQTNKVVTVEEHQITGGLGSAVSEVLSAQYPCSVSFIGMPDCFGESGHPNQLMEKYKLNATAIKSTILDLYTNH